MIYTIISFKQADLYSLRDLCLKTHNKKKESLSKNIYAWLSIIILLCLTHIYPWERVVCTVFILVVGVPNNQTRTNDQQPQQQKMKTIWLFSYDRVRRPNFMCYSICLCHFNHEFLESCRIFLFGIHIVSASCRELGYKRQWCRWLCIQSNDKYVLCINVL